MRPYMEYISYIIDAEATPEAILNTPKQENVQELRSSLVNYRGKFIPSLSTIALPLKLLQHSTQWNWNQACEKAFRQLN